jgi:hypothetical protein
VGLVAAIAVSMWAAGLHVPVARAADEPSSSGTGKHDDPQAAEARRHYEEGTKAFNLGEYPRAVSEFKAAYNAKPDPLLLYNIGQSFRLGGDASQALFFYRSFLRNMPAAPNRKEVEGRIRVLEKQVEEQKRDAPPAGSALSAQPPGTAAGQPPAPGTSPAGEAAPPIGGETTGHRASDVPVGSTAAPVSASPPARPAPPGASGPTTGAPPTIELSQPATRQSPSTSSPFYTRWWFWTGVGVVLLVGIGAAAAARDKVPSTTYGLRDPMFGGSGTP